MKAQIESLDRRPSPASFSCVTFGNNATVTINRQKSRVKVVLTGRRDEITRELARLINELNGGKTDES